MPHRTRIGILALAALRLGAASAIGVDHDPQALEASEENARRNGLGECLRVYLPDDEPRIPADLLLANILANPLRELAARLAAGVNRAGSITFSTQLKRSIRPESCSTKPIARLRSLARRSSSRRSRRRARPRSPGPDRSG